MADNSTRTPGTGEDVRSVQRGGASGVKTQAVIIDKSGGATENLGLTGSKTLSASAPTTTATLVLAANTGRKSAIIRNAGSVTSYMGKDNTVSVANGVPLAPGETLSDTTSTDAWWGITAVGTADLRVCEVA